ncbi:MAG TPA: glycosyltransferase family 4 protein [Thermoanaerobaculia bacterium]|nr:glycosyltransferase family 4 protein [Thermoanaerobaculia bacterium]
MTSRALFWVHDPEAPSFRHRLAAHLPALASAGIAGEVERFPRRRYLLRVLERMRRLRAFDLLVIAKFKLESGERNLVRQAARRIVYDFDDAIYYGKPDRPGEEPDRSPRRVRKFRATCAVADLVTAGNATLAAAARAAARRVEVVPTGIDLSPYPPPAGDPRGGFRIAWIGLPGNLPYLEIVAGALARLAARHPALRLVVVSERPPARFPAPVEFVRWSKEGEAAALSDCDVGIMPLEDDDWTRGKGGFKLLQYMAAGLPTVASPVGVNREIVVEGETGFLAGSAEEWELSLDRLLGDALLRRRMGLAGRRRVEENYAMTIVSRHVVELYRGLLEEGRA